MAISMVSGGYGVAAQNGTGTPATANGTAAGAVHPGHIHTGTCDAVGEVVFPLNDATATDMTGTPGTGANATSDTGANATSDTGANGTPGTGGNATSGDTGSDDMARGEVIAESRTTIEASLDDILGAEHVINFHESAENIDNYIACGTVSGSPDDQDTLEIALDEQNDSGIDGRATLVDSSSGSIEVTVQLWHENGDDTTGDDTGGGTPGDTGDDTSDDTGDDAGDDAGDDDGDDTGDDDADD